MKIETCFIPPIKHQDLALNGSRLFALAHFILEGNQEYINFFKEQSKLGKFILLDSGVAEGHRVPIETFMKCAEDIGATEIICPDELLNTDETIKLTKDFLSKLTEEQKKKYKFMMVPQATNLTDYIRCIKTLQELPECSCIGISKFDAPVIVGRLTDIHKVCQSRKRLVNYLIEEKIINKPIHLLGYDNPIEFSYYITKKFKQVRSCDSASSILCAINNIEFNEENGMNITKPSGGDIYHEIIMSDKQIELAKKNMMIVNKICGNIK